MAPKELIATEAELLDLAISLQLAVQQLEHSSVDRDRYLEQRKKLLGAQALALQLLEDCRRHIATRRRLAAERIVERSRADDAGSLSSDEEIKDSDYPHLGTELPHEH